MHLSSVLGKAFIADITVHLDLLGAKGLFSLHVSLIPQKGLEFHICRQCIATVEELGFKEHANLLLQANSSKNNDFAVCEVSRILICEGI